MISNNELEEERVQVTGRQFGALAKGYARIRASMMREKWAIGIVRAPIHAFLDRLFTPKVQWISDPSRLDYLADCFGVIEGNARIILAERFSHRGSSEISSQGVRRFRTGRGHITSIAIDKEGRVISEAAVIDSGLHMSYPCTVHDHGSWYAVAEEVSRGSLNLYRLSVNSNWLHVKELLPHAVVDPTIVAYDNHWWLFGTSPTNPCSDLMIWSADSLEGNWQPHFGNPVRSSRQNARPGGTPFLFNGHLYRPTQNCVKTYGGSIIINRVDVLTRAAFEESPVREVSPPPSSPYQDGIHTLSTFGDWTLLDAKMLLPLPGVAFRSRLLRFRNLSR